MIFVYFPTFNKDLPGKTTSDIKFKPHARLLVQSQFLISQNITRVGPSLKQSASPRLDLGSALSDGASLLCGLNSGVWREGGSSR